MLEIIYTIDYGYGKIEKGTYFMDNSEYEQLEFDFTIDKPE